MVDYDYYLGLKYAGQGALRQSQAQLNNVQAQNFQSNQDVKNAALTAQAQAGLMDAQSQTGLRGAMADRTRALIDPEIGVMRGQTGLYGEQAKSSAFQRSLLDLDLSPAQSYSLAQRLFPGQPIIDDRRPTAGAMGTAVSGTAPAPLPSGWHSLSILDTNPDGTPKYPGHAKGIAKIPGKGSGKVDTVPAMLAPGEAVLNKGAAEHIGRKTIKHLNTIGQLKMGMVPGKAAGKAAGGSKGKSAPTPAKGSKTPASGPNAGAPQHFAEGTSNVQPMGPGDFMSAVARTAIGQIFGGQQPTMPAQTQAPAPAPAAPTGYSYRSVLDQAPDGSYPVRHYAKGTEKVQPAYATPAQIGTVEGFKDLSSPNAVTTPQSSYLMRAVTPLDYGTAFSTGTATPQYAPLPVQVLTNGVPDDLATVGMRIRNQLGPVLPTQTPVRYAAGTSHVGKGAKTGDTPKPTAQNVRTAIKALQGGMAKKPLPKGFGNPGMV